MANFFIAVGGTGQNVALAYRRLARLSEFEPANIYVMDSDLSITNQQDSFVPLEPIPIEPCILPLQRNSFRDLFNPGGDATIDSMLSVLYTNRELSTPIDDGMFGRPSVGSATIMDKIDLMNRDNTPQQDCRLSDTNFANLLAALQGPGGHRVVICGSAKGGTGAGGVPALAQYVSSRVDRANVQIVVLYFLTHFNILVPTDRLQYDKIENLQLRSNAESGMCYLADEISRGVDACVLFGLLQPIDVPYREAQAQQEVEMFLYLLAAIVGNNSFYANLDALFPANQDRTYAYWIPCDGASDISSLMITDIDVHLPHGNVVHLDVIPKLAQATSVFLKIFGNYINPLPGYSLVPPLVVPKKLRRHMEILKIMMHKNEIEICKDISQDIEVYRTENETNLAWFQLLLRKESDWPAEGRPVAGVLSPDNNKDETTTITGEDYQKTKQQPMEFIRRVIKQVGWKDLQPVGAGASPVREGFVKPFVMELRRSIDEVFFGSVFY